MRRRRRRNQRKSNISLVLFIIFIGTIAIFIFLPELKAIWELLKAIGSFILTGILPRGISNPILWRTFFLIISAVIIYQVSLILVSQYLLPVFGGYNRKLAYEYFRKFLKRKHGKVIFIEDGRIHSENVLQDGKLPTIALVNFNSSAMIDKKLSKKSKNEQSFGKNRLTSSITPRLVNPGVNFIGQNEVVMGPIDLRPQIRIVKDLEAETWDKIKIKTDIQVTFSVGQPPDELLLTFVNEEKTELGVIILSESLVDGLTNVDRKFIIDIVNEERLTESDRQEAQFFYRKWIVSPVNAKKVVVQAKNVDIINNVPYIYDSKRISAASASEVFSEKDRKVIHWSELVLQIIQDHFKLLLSKVTYDDLYSDTTSGKSALANFKERFNQEAINFGVLSYRFVERSDGRLLKAGQEWKEEELNISDIQHFASDHILRNHGIKIINTSFSELLPSDVVRKKMANFWKAKLKKESDIQKAQMELESLEIRKSARTEAQAKSILDYYPGNNEKYAMTDLSVQLASYINEKTTDPQIRKLLSRDQLNKLWTLYKWLRLKSID